MILVLQIKKPNKSILNPSVGPRRSLRHVPLPADVRHPRLHIPLHRLGVPLQLWSGSARRELIGRTCPYGCGNLSSKVRDCVVDECNLLRLTAIHTHVCILLVPGF